VIKIINSKEKPLAVYYYGNNQQNSMQLCKETSSGSFVTNECIKQIISHYQGFGGVGASGYGRYGGYEGYK
jgi:acyl-CoA reductase-like NAD-dependent aldehyde dehydrogenase